MIFYFSAGKFSAQMLFRAEDTEDETGVVILKQETEEDRNAGIIIID